MSSTSGDEEFMGRALALAEQARGLTSPNPLVGAVVVAAGHVVGEGFHAAAGSAHAEVEALAAAGDRARGATLYVTLEPCTHWGRTPPCAPAVVSAGVRRVVAALQDPSPMVAGRGLELLRRAGIDVTVGVLQTQAAGQNRVFLTAMRQGRPHVMLKAAMTLDGKIADIHGESRWITGEVARREAHRLRSEADAIVAGIRTVLRDDPQLTVRLERPWPREPLRVVLDTAARTPPGARLITAGTAARALIAVGDTAPPERLRRLADTGVTLVRLPVRDGRVGLPELLADLQAREIRAVLVEGGGEVHAAFLEAGLVDRVAVFLAPRLMGGREATPMIAGGGLALKHALRLGALSIRPAGEDILIEADVCREPA
ncbi:MAG: bifunctional diaminohydroxyphosphoribosylaminopyrimidine deaminase/5-amino-6-(5-phosphoribosylamino)uracil reductase RibD [Candidatus Rokuibacteriota bacterium]